MVDAEFIDSEFPVDLNTFIAHTNVQELAQAASSADHTAVKAYINKAYHTYYTRPQERTSLNIGVTSTNCSKELRAQIEAIPAKCAPRSKIRSTKPSAVVRANQQKCKLKCLFPSLFPFPVKFDFFRKVIRMDAVLQRIWDDHKKDQPMPEDVKKQLSLDFFHLYYMRPATVREKYRVKFRPCPLDVKTSIEQLPPNIPASSSPSSASAKKGSIQRHSTFPTLFPFPVTFAQFEAAVNLPHILDTILREHAQEEAEQDEDVASGARRPFCADEKLRSQLSRDYYHLYYMEPLIRQRYPLKLRPCPATMRRKLLSSVEEEEVCIAPQFPVDFATFCKYTSTSERAAVLAERSGSGGRKKLHEIMKLIYASFYNEPLRRGTLRIGILPTCPDELRQQILQLPKTAQNPDDQQCRASETTDGCPSAKRAKMSEEPAKAADQSPLGLGEMNELPNVEMANHDGCEEIAPVQQAQAQATIIKESTQPKSQSTPELTAPEHTTQPTKAPTALPTTPRPSMDPSPVGRFVSLDTFIRRQIAGNIRRPKNVELAQRRINFLTLQMLNSQLEGLAEGQGIVEEKQASGEQNATNGSAANSAVQATPVQRERVVILANELLPTMAAPVECPRPETRKRVTAAADEMTIRSLDSTLLACFTSYQAQQQALVQEQAAKLFQKIPRECSLLFALRCSNPMKALILRAVLDMSPSEFVHYTRSYLGDEGGGGDGDGVIQPTWERQRFHDFVFKHLRMWPADLYIPLTLFGDFLEQKNIETIELNLDVVSPKLLHWSDLSLHSDFDECVRLDYTKQTGRVLDVRDKETLMERRVKYYHKCYFHDEWLWRVPVLHNLVAHAPGDGGDMSDDGSTRPRSSQSTIIFDPQDWSERGAEGKSMSDYEDEQIMDTANPPQELRPSHDRQSITGAQEGLPATPNIFQSSGSPSEATTTTTVANCRSSALVAPNPEVSFVAMLNTQQQCESLPAEYGLAQSNEAPPKQSSGNPLETTSPGNKISPSTIQRQEISMNGTCALGASGSTIKQEKIPLLNDLQFIINDDSQGTAAVATAGSEKCSYVCQPIREQTICLDDTQPFEPISDQESMRMPVLFEDEFENLSPEMGDSAGINSMRMPVLFEDEFENLSPEMGDSAGINCDTDAQAQSYFGENMASEPAEKQNTEELSGGNDKNCDQNKIKRKVYASAKQKPLKLIKGYVPQLTHTFRPLPITVLHSAPTAKQPPNVCGEWPSTSTAATSQAFATDNTMFNNTTLTLLLDQRLSAPSGRSTAPVNSTSSSCTATIPNSNSKVAKRQVNALEGQSPPLPRSIPPCARSGMKQDTVGNYVREPQSIKSTAGRDPTAPSAVLFRVVKKLNFFTELSLQHCTDLEVTAVGLNTPRFYVLLQRKRIMRVKFDNLRTLLPYSSSALLIDLNAMLLAVNEFHYNPFHQFMSTRQRIDRRTSEKSSALEHLSRRVLRTFFDAQPSFGISELAVNTLYSKGTLFYPKPKKTIAVADLRTLIKPKVLDGIRRLKTEMYK